MADLTFSDRMVMLGRGFRMRCPRCGNGGIFAKFAELVNECPRCGLKFAHEEGYWLGAMTLNTGFTLFPIGIAIGIAVALTWPHIPVWLILIPAIIAGIILPILFYPMMKTLWVAVDLGYMHHQKPWRPKRRGKPPVT